ncbi:hypothetical protein [Altererythrobacter sp. MTPC7]|uniref:hypothetical protein n=1 Tax=Altererythrobacter sp. MTPC7 TaxID=3056567 RepID=UPI0036F2C667
MLGALELADSAQYRTFLQVQYAARRPVEDWLATYEMSIPVPPAMSPLIAADLGESGETLANPQGGTVPAFYPTAGADPLGAAWVLAGSSLGNRAMLADLGKRDALPAAVRFLSSPDMVAYFAELRRAIEVPCPDPADASAAIAGAAACFGHFRAVCEAMLPARIREMAA